MVANQRTLGIETSQTWAAPAVFGTWWSMGSAAASARRLAGSTSYILRCKVMYFGDLENAQRCNVCSYWNFQICTASDAQEEAKQVLAAHHGMEWHGLSNGTEKRYIYIDL